MFIVLLIGLLRVVNAKSAPQMQNGVMDGSNRNEFSSCDQIVCPGNAARCVVTTARRPGNLGVIVRTEKCLDMRGNVIKSHVTLNNNPNPQYGVNYQNQMENNQQNGFQSNCRSCNFPRFTSPPFPRGIFQRFPQLQTFTPRMPIFYPNRPFSGLSNFLNRRDVQQSPRP